MNRTRRLLISILTLLCCMEAWAQSASNVLSGEFTINASGAQVQFSKGNLQYVNGKYQFAEHQYDYIGNNQDWFAFNDYSAPSDGILWYVLSRAEWEYLFVSRTVTNTLSPGARYSKATIGGTYKGVIVFPDNYTHPEGTGFEGNCENATEAYTSTVSLEGWALMEAAGCVFLPAAGYSTNSGQINKTAIYQSTTSAGGNTYYTPGFYIDYIAMDDWSNASTKVPVRFVQLKTNLQKDSEGYYLIGSVQDWQDFATLVQTTPTAKVKMTADIDLGNDQTMIGDTGESTSSPCFSGIFDGQGYTLTVAYTGIGSSSVGAPFAKIKGATIKNLHVKGSLSSAGYHPTSIVSDSWGTSRLEKVWGEVDITGTRTGWVEASGLVGCMKAGNLTIEDCLFTGTVNGSGSYNGCFIGYIDSGSATITNSLSTGTFSYSGGSNEFRGTHTNCYVKQFPTTIPANMQVTDAELSDGTTATALQNSREEEVWVQDPLTNQPMLKTFATAAYTVPSSGIGTFSAAAKFAVPDGLTAHYCKTYNSANGTIGMVAIDGAVPANTGVVMRGTPGETYTLTGTNSDAATIEDNALVAVVEATHVNQTATVGDDEYTNFMMSGGKFVKIATSDDPDVKMPANRAYLQILTSALPTGTSARSITLSWDNEATGIIPMDDGRRNMEDVKGALYDLQGRRINGRPTTKGLYIVNGKLVVIK